jgi:hypothetical protein
MLQLEPRTSLLFWRHCHQIFARSSDDLLTDFPTRGLQSNLSSQVTAIRRRRTAGGTSIRDDGQCLLTRRHRRGVILVAWIAFEREPMELEIER